MAMSINALFGKSAIYSGIEMMLKGGLAARLGSQAICTYNQKMGTLDVLFPAYRAKVRNLAIDEAPRLSDLIGNFSNILGDHDDALAAAYLPWFVQRKCRLQVSAAGGLKLQLFLESVDHEKEAKRLCSTVKVAYGLDPQPDEPGMTYYTPIPEDEKSLEEIHRLNAHRLAALA